MSPIHHAEPVQSDAIDCSSPSPLRRAAPVGGIARYTLTLVVQDPRMLAFPVGTLAVNVIACLLIGAIAQFALTILAHRAPAVRALAHHRILRWLHDLLDVQLREYRTLLQAGAFVAADCTSGRTSARVSRSGLGRLRRYWRRSARGRSFFCACSVCLDPGRDIRDYLRVNTCPASDTPAGRGVPVPAMNRCVSAG